VDPGLETRAESLNRFAVNPTHTQTKILPPPKAFGASASRLSIARGNSKISSSNPF
jgi:hypothetical protein